MNDRFNTVESQFTLAQQVVHSLDERAKGIEAALQQSGGCGFGSSGGAGRSMG